MSRKSRRNTRAREQRRTVVRKPPRITRRRIMTSLLGVAALGLLLALAIRVHSDLRQAQVVVEVTELADVELRYAKPQWETISPLCGCMMDQAAATWRGISFIARDSSIARAGEFPNTAYTITSPMPGMISWTPEVFPTDVHVYAIALRADTEFNPTLLVTDPTAYPKRRDLAPTPDLFYTLMTKAPLHVRLLGDTPMGAWIPTSASKFVLPLPSSGFAAARRSFSFHEYYPAQSYRANDNATAAPAEYPLVDFLGKLVLWTDDESATFLSHDSIFTTDGLPGRRILAVVVDPPFATRLTIQPVRRDVAELLRRSVTEKEGLRVWYGDRDDGEVSVDIANAFEQASEFDQVYARLSKSDITTARMRPLPRWRRSSEKLSGIAEMVMRYPPLPPNSGFNIFGELRSLALTRAKANLRINGEESAISTPSNIVLSDIRGYDVDSGAIKVPLSLDTSKRAVDVVLRGSAAVTIDGRDAMTLPRRFRPHVDWINTLLSIGASAATILAFALAVRRKA